MKNKKLICSLLLLLSISCIPQNANAQNNSNPSPEESVISYSSNGDDEATPYAYDIRWVYKIENGITYRRKYNYSTGQWIGDWERVN